MLLRYRKVYFQAQGPVYLPVFDVFIKVAVIGRKVAVHDVVDVIDQFVAIVGVPGKNKDRPRFYVRSGKLLPINVVCPPVPWTDRNPSQPH